MQHSHGKYTAYITRTAIEVIEYIKSQGEEIRFRSEDYFRSNLVDLLTVYPPVNKVGVDRVGIADTVWVATPSGVSKLAGTRISHPIY